MMLLPDLANSGLPGIRRRNDRIFGGAGDSVPLDPALASILTAAPGSTVLWPSPQYWFQDSAGTVPVTAEGQRIKCWIAQDGKRWVQTGADSLAPTAGKFPNGEWGALFSGGQSLASQVAFDLSSQTQAALFIGSRKTSDATNGVIIEQGPNATTSPGFNIFAPAGTIEYRQWLRVGTNNTSISFDSSTYAAPHTATLTGLFTTGTQQIARINGIEQTTTAPAGNLASDVIYLGARAGVNSFFNGLIGPVVLRGGALPNGAAVTSIEDVITDKVGVPSPLQAFYNSGTIGIHLATDTVIPVGGPATAITNKGGAGSAFDATVSGPAIPVSGNFLECGEAVGFPVTANQADLIGVRLMWVARPASATGSYRYFGQNQAINTNIRINNGSTLNLLSNRNGTNESVVISGIPTSAVARLFELEMSPTQATLWVNGALIGSASHPWSAFNIDRIAQGNATTQLFVGSMGDVLGVITGQSDTAAAISAARAYAAERFGITVAA